MNEPTIFPLWEQGAPGALGDGPDDRPTLTVFQPDAPNGMAVVVCPGGGYNHLATGHEGKDIGAWLCAQGITAFMLTYRHGPTYRHPIPLLDAQRAVRTVRARAAEWDVDPQRIGIWGFSAGGHLASTAATHFDAGDPRAEDPIERAGCRPDFLILAYPVVTLYPDCAHMGSRNNLLGPDADPALVELLSNDRQVTADTPPTFLFHTSDDPAVPVQNSIRFYLALRSAGVPAEMHIYQHGRHGVGLAPDDPILCTWADRLEAWLGQWAMITV